MSGSVAEERIRAKAEAVLRRRYPSARIIHELVLEQGGVRLDLAAVTDDWLVVVEIKSERDVLKRLKSQVERAQEVAQEVWVVVAEKHVPAVNRLQSRFVTVPLPEPIQHRGWVETTKQVQNEDRLHALDRCWLLREGEGDDLPCFSRWDRSPPRRHLIAPGRMLQMLWRDELYGLTRPLGPGPRSTRTEMIYMAVELMTGREIRRGVCAALRTRPFARADEPMKAAA